ncbi:uncharacterized protein BXZ73DRAFT_82848 [Epithele typhae]|uniref:uncharacterized protein n=1 Tax=Epithele typhae TaxID=378194 RepID=UPI002007C4FC|nr:uncharacterized protein BXZ73DRAFT_82848 [Epithele typhae]KAH9911339.1 hypothetical protein BXZ73DRAFT_82848 [Epithele typhae]
MDPSKRLPGSKPTLPSFREMFSDVSFNVSERRRQNTQGHGPHALSSRHGSRFYQRCLGRKLSPSGHGPATARDCHPRQPSASPPTSLVSGTSCPLSCPLTTSTPGNTSPSPPLPSSPGSMARRSVESLLSSASASAQAPDPSQHPNLPTYHLSAEECPPGDDRRHACGICHRRFSRPSSLHTHMNAHTGAQRRLVPLRRRPAAPSGLAPPHPGPRLPAPYAFRVSSFVSPFPLSRHLRPDAADPAHLSSAYKCPFPGCARRFSVNSNMRRHCRNHRGGAALSKAPLPPRAGALQHQHPRDSEEEDELSEPE